METMSLLGLYNASENEPENFIDLLVFNILRCILPAFAAYILEKNSITLTVTNQKYLYLDLYHIGQNI